MLKQSFRSTLVAVLVLMATSAACAYDANDCAMIPETNHTCTGKAELSDMGFFDEEGTWQWNAAFAAEIDDWTGEAIPDWRERWRPRKEVRVTSARMDLRRYPQSTARQPNTRIALSLQEATWVPQLWRAVNDMNEIVFFGAFVPPGTCGQNGAPIEDECACIQADLANDAYDYLIAVNCQPGENCYDPCDTGYWWDPFADPAIESDPDVPDCCKPWKDLSMAAADPVPFAADRIDSLTWVENASVAAGVSEAVAGNMTYLRYALYPTNFWYERGIYENGTEFYFVFADNQLPQETGLQHLTLTYDGGKTIDLEFEVTSMEVLPTVPARLTQTQTVVSRSAKTIKGLSSAAVEVDNLTARELDGRLIIQWAEPDGALRPGLMLRVYVGKYHNVAANEAYERFLWIDCPAQLGTVVVPAAIWGELKAQLTDGFGPIPPQNTFEVGGMYRITSEHQMPNGTVTGFHNRGYFEWTEFPLN